MVSEIGTYLGKQKENLQGVAGIYLFNRGN